MRRLKLDHADWHVTLRGARRLILFHDASDYSTFYGMLGRACQDSETSLIADCLMSNHFHLSLSGGSKQLTRCMQRLDRAYSGYHNERYGLSGHAFEQGYYSEPITSDFLLKRVVRYIHLNPVRGGKVAKPENYPWSSYQRLISCDPDALGKDERRVLSIFDPDLAQARTAYQAFVEKDLHRKFIVPVGRTPAWEIWREQFTWVLEFVQDRQGQLHPLEYQRVAIYLGARVGIPARAMGLALGHPDGKAISQISYRMARLLERDPLLKGKVEALHVL